MKKLIALIIVVVVIAAGVYFFKNGEAEDENGKPANTTVVVKRGYIALKVETTGRVVANLDVEIKCKASGEVIDLPFDVSDVVKKGDLLLKLDPVDEKRRVGQAEATLSASNSRLAKAEANLLIARKDLAAEKGRATAALDAAKAHDQDARARSSRTAQLLEKKLVSQEEYDAARTAAVQASTTLRTAKIRMEELDIQEMGLELKKQDVVLANTQVESDNISLSISEQRLEDTMVYAPISGTVTERNVQTGQIISSGISNVGGGTRVLLISDLSRLFILAAVDESDIGRVRVGQSVKITADAFPDLTLKGSVVRIAARGVSTSSVVTFEVKIEVLDRGRRMLKPEMTANVEIVVAEKDDVLHVPSEAVFRKKGKKYVTLLKKDGTTEDREVETGIITATDFEITSGLAAGESVLVSKKEADSRWRRRGPMGMMMKRKKK